MSPSLWRNTDLRLLTDRDPEALEVYRHSSAHLLAAAVLELFPETKLGHGPPTDTGFFYDFYRPTPFTPKDLQKIEKKMQEPVQRDIPYARESVGGECNGKYFHRRTTSSRAGWFDRAHTYDNVRFRVHRYVLVPLLFPFIRSDFRGYLKFPDCGS